MPSPERPCPIWVRANPRGLTAQEIAHIRGTRHLTEVDMPKRVYRALIRAGHRYVGELAYVKLEELKSLPWMEVRDLPHLKRVLRLCFDVEIGGKVGRERVFAPEARLVSEA
jgi:hypothetical protein